MLSLIRSILAATDLGPGSDAILRSAASVAARTGADLHVLHSLEFPLHRSAEPFRGPSFHGRIDEAEERLREQVEQAVPERVRVASRRVIIYVAHKAILERAEEVAADLIVIGRHRGGAVGAHFLGSTAERVIRTALVPCLVVTEPLEEKLRRIGVPLDFADPSQGALEIALGWGLEAGEPDGGAADGRPEIHVMHVGWTVERIDDPAREDRLIRPELERHVERARSRVPGAEALAVGVEVLWAYNETEATLRWVRKREIDLLVVGTHGSRGLKRALIGSMASSIARQAPCPVLLVPPSLWSGRRYEPRLERVIVATDFGEPSVQAARWSAAILAPEAEHLLVHVLDIPEPPGLLAGRFGSREELLRTARTGAEERIRDLTEALEEPKEGAQGAVRTDIREGRPADEIVRLAEEVDADLIVMGGHGPGDRDRGAWTLLGTTAERVLRASAKPVLVARGVEQAPPRGLLVPVEGSAASLRALAWGRFLSGRFDVPLTALYVESPAIYQDADMVPSSADPSIAGEGPGEKAEWVREREGWLREQVRRARIDADTISVRIAVGKPATEILAARDSVGADMIVMGSRGAGAIGRGILGSVAVGVLREAAGPVLIVKPERAASSPPQHTNARLRVPRTGRSGRGS